MKKVNLDELKASTLRSYIDKGRRDADLGGMQAAAGRTPRTPYEKKLRNRYKGSVKATMKLSKGDYQKEDVELREDNDILSVGQHKVTVNGKPMTLHVKKNAKSGNSVHLSGESSSKKQKLSGNIPATTTKKAYAGSIHRVYGHNLSFTESVEVDELFNPANPSAYGVNAYKPSAFASAETHKAEAKKMKELKKKSEKKPSIFASAFGVKNKTKIKEDIDMNKSLILQIAEGLSTASRIAKAAHMRRYEPILTKKRELAMRKASSASTISRKAQKKAHDVIMQKRFLKTRSKESLSPSEKAAIEDKMRKMEPAIKRLASKMFTKVKAADVARRASYMKTHH